MSQKVVKDICVKLGKGFTFVRKQCIKFWGWLPPERGFCFVYDKWSSLC